MPGWRGFMLPKQRLKKKYLTPYIAWKSDQSPYMGIRAKEALDEFIDWLPWHADLDYITPELVNSYLSEKFDDTHWLVKENARRSINAWLRYLRARGHKYLLQVLSTRALV